MGLTVFSYGGGVQSTAALVLAARGELTCDAFLFCNVGDDSEEPETLRYFREVAMPFAQRHGVPLHELPRQRRDGSVETLYGRLTRVGSRSIPIPVRMLGNGAPGNRACTADFKIRVVAKWVREHGASRKDPATVMLGISMDEFQRMRSDSGIPYTRNAYPLIERRMSRADCVNLIRSAGLPVPPKSSCWFCPFHSLNVWREMYRDRPELFGRAVALEALLNERRGRLGRDPIRFSRTLQPLSQAVGSLVQPSLLSDEDACESGFCMV